MDRLLARLANAVRKLVAWIAGETRQPDGIRGNGPPAGHGGSREPSTANAAPDPEYRLLPDTSWDGLNVGSERIDPNLRLIVSLLEALDAPQFYRRTGIRLTDGRLQQQRLPLFLELETGGRGAADIAAMLALPAGSFHGLHVPRAYLNEHRSNDKISVVTAELELADVELSSTMIGAYAANLRKQLAAIINDPGIRRVSMPVPLQPALVDSLHDIEMPADRMVRAKTVDGRDTIVGIIDDGCALAHPDFLVPGTTTSRIQYLWDQARTDKTGGWTLPVDVNNVQDFDSGLELTNAAISAAIAQPGHVNGGVIDEDKVHAYLGYEIDLASHGTHVMDIAAGNGASLMGSEGMATRADIIFVQLPRDLVDQGGPLLEDKILQGVKYIFARAEALGAQRGKTLPAVVNISYGGYSGPHDGTSPLPSGIDQLLDAHTDRAVVVSAGNGFEADCHAMQKALAVGAVKSLSWIVSPEDPTANLLEVWYEGKDRLKLSLTPPGASAPLAPPVLLGESKVIVRQSDQGTVGWINHVATVTGHNLNVIRIWLGPTVGEDGSTLTATVGQQAATALPALTAPAASGVWTVDLENVGNAAATLHAWIERDDLGRRGAPRRQQSRFDPADADPRHTLAGLATGKHSICVGAYNTATDETCRYSAAGPTRDGRRKPDVCAPAEEDAAGRGILCASSRRAQPTRMNGTSASAPHVAGLVALMFQFNRDMKGAPLTAEDIRTKLAVAAAGAQALPPPPRHKLRPNRHQEVDATRSKGKRQSDHFADVIGAGKINLPESLKQLP